MHSLSIFSQGDARHKFRPLFPLSVAVPLLENLSYDESRVRQFLEKASEVKNLSQIQIQVHNI